MTTQEEQEANSYKHKLVGSKVESEAYCLRDLIGSGYSAYVFRATKGDQDFAVKVIKKRLVDEDPEDQLKRIAAQQQFSQSKPHPNLIRIVEAGVCQNNVGLLYVVMPYLDSAKYVQLDKVKGDISPANIRLLLSQISSAARSLHEAGLVHRDIKPSNVMIRSDHQHAILLDLGVMKDIRWGFPEKDYSGKPNDPELITLRFRPPELLSQANFKRFEKKYDWTALSFYQLGAVLYYFLTRKLPFSDSEYHPAIDAAVRRGISKKEIADLEKDEANQVLVDLLLRSMDRSWEARRKRVKWSDFDYIKLEPTLVFLYAGGTIGSSEENGSHKQRGARSSDHDTKNFFDVITKRVRDDYQQINEPNAPFPFQIVWESITPDKIILSENATPAYWNVLLRKIEQIVTQYGQEHVPCPDEQETLRAGRYLAGIVILHGTDTLAYTAPALAFGMKNLPCPVIITGSNQPPNEEDNFERSLLTSKSDVWRNLRLAVNFLRTFGHRYTEVFVVFNATVFHAMNIKKVPLHHSFESRDSLESVVNEPYAYQSIYLPQKYMFKWVDGFFCNNFYPIYGTGYNAFLNGHLHTRENIFAPIGKLIITEYADIRSELVVASPISNYSGLSIDECDAIILIGYDSATFPSISEHALSHSLKRWSGKKPIFLLSEFGIFPTDIKYDLNAFLKDQVSPIALHGIIKETAIPLILHLLSKYRSEKENAVQSVEGPQRDDTEAIRAYMTKQVTMTGWKNSLPGILLDNPFRHDNLRYNITTHLAGVQSAYQEDEQGMLRMFEGRLKRYWGTRPKPEVTHEESESKPRFTLNLPIELSLWFILRKCKTAFSLGYGPTAFKELNDLGFKFGRDLFAHLKNSAMTIKLEDHERWTLLSDTTRKNSIFSEIERLVKQFSDELLRMGLARARCELHSNEEGGYVGMTMKVTTPLVMALGANKGLAVKQFDKEEHHFFSAMQSGTPPHQSVTDFLSHLNAELKELSGRTWKSPTVQPIGWLLLGIYKGLFVEILAALKYDKWVASFISGEEQQRSKRLLRVSIKTNITTSGEEEFGFILTYSARSVVK